MVPPSRTHLPTRSSRRGGLPFVGIVRQDIAVYVLSRCTYLAVPCLSRLGSRDTCQACFSREHAQGQPVHFLQLLVSSPLERALLTRSGEKGGRVGFDGWHIKIRVRGVGCITESMVCFFVRTFRSPVVKCCKMPTLCGY